MKIYLTFLVLVLAMLGMWAQEKTNLVVTMTDGQTHAVALEDYPVVTMDGENLNIVSQNLSISLYLATVADIKYDPTTGIENIISKGGFHILPDQIILNADDAEMFVEIYAINGAKLRSVSLPQGQRGSISLDSLPAGVYVVNINGESVKIVK